ncbi:hypothetical protein [Tindallia californiensis]|uniref:Germination protein YpeB n=1 Tax=Tindallia californiensis TaxID=159292 RepID=A0A1H3L846_9FIRM|nr:hypothetical protein [Tindallia californiensis]SDY60118.1 hypothetical protein SAMN05192546_10391 [Tindallia californiensis]
MKANKLTAIIASVLFISFLINGFLYREVQKQEHHLEVVRQMTSENIERITRHSIRQMDLLLESESPESLMRLQWGLEELASAFQQWVMLNEREDQPNKRLQEGLEGIEALRNVIMNHLDRQYQNQKEQLSYYDREMLEKMQDQLQRFLMIYHNIEGRLDKLVDPSRSDGGLGQISEQIQEIAVLYRHSATPNYHPEYMEIEEAVEIAWDAMAFLEPVEIVPEQETVFIRNGIHAYRMILRQENGKESRIEIDAQNGRIRGFQTLMPSPGEVHLTMEEAMETALRYIDYEGEFSKEVYFQPVNGTTEEPFYAFLFAPLRDDIEIISDAYRVQVSAVDGRLLQLQNGYCRTQVPTTPVVITRQDIRKQWTSELGMMTYNGLSVVRSFDTHYAPKLVHSFRVTKGGQRTMVYFDVMNGNLIHESIHIYDPMLL